jgi:DNA-directed RNA polymerase subunit RPC12/RpoP
MSRIVTCLDCPLYQKGGYCGHYRKDVGALQPACDHAKKLDLTFNPENKDDDMTHIASIPAAPQTKVCCACGRELPLDAFGKHARTKDGLQPRCRECSGRALKDGRKKTDKEIQNAILMADTEAAMEPKKPTTAKTELRQDPKLEYFPSKALADELRASGYYVKAERPITIVEEL